MPASVTTDYEDPLVRCHSVDLDAVAEARLVHSDLWDANVFVDPVSLTVTG